MFRFAHLKTSNLAGRELEVCFSVRSTPVAQRWSESLFQANKNSSIFEKTRMYNFPGHPNNSVLAISSQIEKSIWVINSVFPNLIEGMRPEDSVQENVNRIHSHFADTNLEKRYVTEHTRVAWNDLNNALHAYESYLRSKNIETVMGLPECNMVLTWQDPFYQPLQPEDYEHFTVAKKFGTLYIAYCQVGRHLFEMFLANDDIASDEHVFPLQRLSANTYFWFGPTTSKNSLARLEDAIKNWFFQHRERLNKLGFQWGDPRLAIGWIPVGDIVGPYNNLESQLALVKELGKMSEISSFIPQT